MRRTAGGNSRRSRRVEPTQTSCFGSNSSMLVYNCQPRAKIDNEGAAPRLFVHTSVDNLPAARCLAGICANDRVIWRPALLYLGAPGTVGADQKNRARAADRKSTRL